VVAFVASNVLTRKLAAIDTFPVRSATSALIATILSPSSSTMGPISQLLDLFDGERGQEQAQQPSLSSFPLSNMNEDFEYEQAIAYGQSSYDSFPSFGHDHHSVTAAGMAATGTPTIFSTPTPAIQANLSSSTTHVPSFNMGPSEDVVDQASQSSAASAAVQAVTQRQKRADSLLEISRPEDREILQPGTAAKGPLPRKKAPRPKKTVTAAPAGPITPLDRTPHPRMNNPQDCREFLASLNTLDVKQMDISGGDDWELVKAHRSEEFIDRIYHAILVGPKRVPPFVPKLEEEELQRLDDQQSGARQELHARLQEKHMTQVADAQSQLLFDTAVKMHEYGVNPNKLEKAKKELKEAAGAEFIPRELDLFKCSKRLELIVTVIESHKLVATDVLDGKNFDKIAQNPRGILDDKIEYLKSNCRRQKTYKDAQAAVKSQKQDTKDGPKKRKRAVDAGEAADEGQDLDSDQVAVRTTTEQDGGEDGDEEYMPSSRPKRKRTKTQGNSGGA
jgi:hypothetical protein